MKVEVVEEGFSNTYFVGNEKEFVIIDPSIDIRSVKYVINKHFKDSSFKAILLTHTHYDHFVKIEDVQKTYNVPIYVSKEDSNKLYDIYLSCASHFGINELPIVRDVNYYQDELCFDTLKFKVIKTPGHTNGSVSLLIEKNLFSGDTLFFNSVGRTDLPTGNNNDLITSLKKLMKLDRDIIVYPGHDMSTSIGYEMDNNYYLITILQKGL